MITYYAEKKYWNWIAIMDLMISHMTQISYGQLYFDLRNFSVSHYLNLDAHLLWYLAKSGWHPLHVLNKSACPPQNHPPSPRND